MFKRQFKENIEIQFLQNLENVKKIQCKENNDFCSINIKGY